MITATNTDLLERLLDSADQEIWREFDERYRQVVVAFARRLGLQEADAADAAQDALIQFAKQYRAGKYDRDRARLRSWLLGIAKRCAIAQQRKQRRQKGWRGESAFDQRPPDATINDVWEEEWRNAILRQSMHELRAEAKIHSATIHAFELYAYENLPVKEVAEAVGMTVNQVYVAKSRVIKRLQEIMGQLEDVW